MLAEFDYLKKELTSTALMVDEEENGTLRAKIRLQVLAFENHSGDILHMRGKSEFLAIQMEMQKR